FYDDFGNTIHKEHSDGSTQNLHYDLFDRLVKVETFNKNAETGEWDKEVWVFEYDALDRRVSKGRLKNGGMETIENVSDGLRDNACLNTPNSKDILDSEITFLWDGSRLLQEQNSDGLYTYIYTDQDSYEPLAQIHNYTNTGSESKQEINYFHCDQIGIPREMTDKNGKLLWFGKYDAWGKLTEETNVTGTAHQPFRLQNQYCDSEIRLHYNFFRYYDSDVGRFVNQDPIGLNGSINSYTFAFNTSKWIDPLGWSCDAKKVKELASRLSPKVKQRFKCEDFADALQKEMEKEGISGERVKVKTHSNKGAYGNIWSDKAGANISENGIHHAIKCGDTVFDNMNPGGIEHNKWVSDLFSPGGHSFSSVSF
ncbi:RHS repeat domain-containing protein, partial [Neisseria canis]